MFNIFSVDMVASIIKTDVKTETNGSPLQRSQILGLGFMDDGGKFFFKYCLTGHSEVNNVLISLKFYI